jgi:hypothetical protein
MPEATHETEATGSNIKSAEISIKTERREDTDPEINEQSRTHASAEPQFSQNLGESPPQTSSQNMAEAPVETPATIIHSLSFTDQVKTECNAGPDRENTIGNPSNTLESNVSEIIQDNDNDIAVEDLIDIKLELEVSLVNNPTETETQTALNVSQKSTNDIGNPSNNLESTVSEINQENEIDMEDQQNTNNIGKKRSNKKRRNVMTELPNKKKKNPDNMSLEDREADGTIEVIKLSIKVVLSNMPYLS